MSQKKLPAKLTEKLQLSDVVDDLVEHGLVNEEHRWSLLMSAHNTTQKGHQPLHVFEVIARQQVPLAGDGEQFISVVFLSKWLASKVSLAYWHIDPLKVDVGAVSAVMSYAYAARFNILAVEVNDDEVVIATAEPFVRSWESEIEQILGKTVRRVIANPVDIRRYLLEFYNMSRSVLGAKEEHGSASSGIEQNLEQMMELGQRDKLEANDQHVISVVDWLLQYAFEQRSSDIHLEPRRDKSNVRFRIDGILHTVYELPPTVMTAVLSRIKILGRMDVAEKRRPQDGRLMTRTKEGKETELRLSTMPTAFGEKMVMRVFDPEVLLKDDSELGFTARESTIWQQIIKHSNGMVLVTGPTGSGKTTTLYSSLKQLATGDVNICTVEDPIEQVEPAFNQMQVQPKIDLDFASGVRTLLRQDPDIIMVGEIRDLETAETAAQAALTGHLVFSTLHTNDAVSAIVRLRELGIADYLISEVILGVLAQRLVRKLCPHCTKPMKVNETLWKGLVHPWSAKTPEKINQAVGCIKCRHTGYMGRVGIYEMVTVLPAMKEMIAQGASIEALRRQALKEGAQPLRLSGANKVAAGMTTIEEILKCAPPPIV